MIWNRWECSRRASDSDLMQAAGRAVEPVRVSVARIDQRVTWTFSKSVLEHLAEVFENELAYDWRGELDDIDASAYEIVVDVDHSDDATFLTWDPKSGDNHAAWPIAWVIVRRFTETLGATQVTVSAQYLLAAATDVGGEPPVLPLIVLRQACALPTGRQLPLAFERPESIIALRRAVAVGTLPHCVVAVQRDPLIDHPQATDLHPTACVARIEALEETSRNANAIIVGIERVGLSRIERSGDGSFEAWVTRLNPVSARPELRGLLLYAAEQAVGLTIEQDLLADDALEVLRQLPLERLADGAAEVFVGFIDPDVRIDILQTQDPSERLMIAIEELTAFITRAAEALANHGDIDAARLSLLEAEVADLETDLATRR